LQARDIEAGPVDCNLADTMRGTRRDPRKGRATTFETEAAYTADQGGPTTMGYEDTKADVKESMRNVDNKAKETWRKADGNESLSDKVANAGDDIRDAAGNAGDEVRRHSDDMDDRDMNPDRPY